MNGNKLPNKPSELLEVAMHDLSLVERSSKYKVDMWSWHKPTGAGYCEVCMAGAVMAKTLHVDSKVYKTASSFDARTDRKLWFISKASVTGFTGEADMISEVRAAFHLCIGRETVVKIRKVAILKYSTSPRAFKARVRKIIRLLKEAGL